MIHELVKIGYDYLPKGIGVVAINSNDVSNYPDDHPDRMKELALSLKFLYPYLFDETQEVAKAFDAACTPDFNLFDINGKRYKHAKHSRAIYYLSNICHLERSLRSERSLFLNFT